MPSLETVLLGQRDYRPRVKNPYFLPICWGSLSIFHVVSYLEICLSILHQEKLNNKVSHLIGCFYIVPYVLQWQSPPGQKGHWPGGKETYQQQLGMSHGGALRLCERVKAWGKSWSLPRLLPWRANMLSHLIRSNSWQPHGLWPASLLCPWAFFFFLPPEYWSGLPFPTPRDPPNRGIEPMSSALQADSLPLSYWESPKGLTGSRKNSLLRTGRSQEKNGHSWRQKRRTLHPSWKMISVGYIIMQFRTPWSGFEFWLLLISCVTSDKRVSQVAQMEENWPANAVEKRDAGWIPGLGISPGEGNSNPLQYSCLGNYGQRSLAGHSLCSHKSQTYLLTKPPLPLSRVAGIH